ncbi:MAG: dTDP-4-dehydrorhamnose reductase [Bacteroides sp.]|nr:dTDP-4-dehydrorhamnose reductase [Prevotella sp.]MCM1407877.1 dTDP-4-dehydrorhamnose reductase [Treponema brennaborense]MCM1469619.1 dTDP-4-dehydrorhamnose reductase [Bacteroides sp.]
MEKNAFLWLIGCSGMLGAEIARQCTQSGIPFVGTDREIDITDRNALEAFAESDGKCSWIVNCAAYTAVDKAEDEIDAARRLNTDGPRNIAAAAKKTGAKLIHISTDYVFDGSASVPYTEDTEKCPASVYGETKAAGEDAVLALLPESSYIIRTAWLYGYDGKNFVYTMTRAMNEYDSRMVVDDQRGTPTFAKDLADVILRIIKSEQNDALVPAGIYHCTDIGNISWFDFASEIYRLGREKKLITSECEIIPCKTNQFPTKAKRPAYSVLSKEKIQKALGITLPHWQESLDAFMSSPLFSVK